jgi:hypothetical protein
MVAFRFLRDVLARRRRLLRYTDHCDYAGFSRHFIL